MEPLSLIMLGAAVGDGSGKYVKKAWESVIKISPSTPIMRDSHDRKQAV